MFPSINMISTYENDDFNDLWNWKNYGDFIQRQLKSEYHIFSQSSWQAAVMSTRIENKGFSPFMLNITWYRFFLLSEKWL